MAEKIYDASFYEDLGVGSARSAQAILEIAFEKTIPKSIVDFGCGRGAWLSVAESLGAEELAGFDGPWVDQGKLLSSRINFRAIDFTADISLSQKYDLAISVEVAEHLPPERADWFVETICRASDVALFGAAPPGQDGTNHVNEQWPSYWAKRFARHGFVAVDLFRPRLWSNEAVEWWYRQNTLLYVNRSADLPQALAELPNADLDRIDIVHPQMFRLREGQRARLWLSYNRPSLSNCLGVFRNFLATRLKAATRSNQR